MTAFPSREWVEAVLELAQKSEPFKEASRDWEGDFLCIIQCDEEFLSDLSRREVVDGLMSFLYIMAEDSRKKYRGTRVGDFLEKELGISLDAPPRDCDANRIIASSIPNISISDLGAATLYFWVDLWHGSIRHMTAVAPGEREDAAFKLSGKYGTWRRLISGQQDIMRLVVSNGLKLEGNMSYMMRHLKAVKSLTREVFAGVQID